MRLQLRALALVLAAATPAVAATHPANPATGPRAVAKTALALVGATVHVRPGEVLTDAAVVIRDERIVAVGRNLAIPADATVVDAKGLVIYPGFVDPLTEYGQTPPGRADRRGREIQYDRSGSGSASWNDAVRAERVAAAALAPSADAAKAFLDRGVTTVVSVARDGIFRGRAAVVSLADASADEVILSSAGPHVLSFDKGTSTQAYPTSQMGSIALVRQTLLDAEHAHRNPAAPLDLAVSALARDLYAGKPRPAVLFETSDEQSLLRAARIGRELGVPMVHVGSGFEYRVLDQVAATKSTVVLPARLPKKPEVGTSAAALDVTLGDLRHWERAPGNAGALVDAGIPVAFTATGLGPSDDPFAAIRAAVEAGLSTADALAALTTVPAHIAGVADQVGELAVGRRGDLVIATGDLFTDPSAVIRSVWIGGRLAREPNPPKLDLRGRWAWQVAGVELELDFEGDQPGAGRGVVRRPAPPTDEAPAAPVEVVDKTSDPAATTPDKPKEVSLDGLSVGSDTASFRVALDDFGIVGVARVEIASLPAGLEIRSDLPDGTSTRTALTRRAEATVKPAKEPPARADLVSRQTLPAGSAFGLDAPVAQEDVLVRGATVWTSGPAGRLDDADLLIRGGRIAAVGSGLDAPAGVRVIDGTGLHVTAGLIDEHSHLAIDGGVNEGSHPVTSEVRIADVLDPNDVGIWRALAGGTTTMQLLHGSANPIGGQAAVVKLRWGSSADELLIDTAPPSIKFALGENVKQSNWDNPGPRYPKTRMGVEARIRDAFLAAKAYRDAHQAFGRLSAAERTRQVAPRRDLQLEALVEILEGKRIIHCHSYVQSEILSLIRLADELGFKVGTFTHILEGYKVAPEIAAHGAGASSFADWWAYKLEVYDAIPHNACLLTRAGVLTSINSDSGELIRRLNQEASKSVLACGMEETAALDMVTINPARQLGIDDRVGSLEVGKDADFVIWNGHPLSTLSRVEQTWVDGRPLFTRERDAALRTAATQERQALIQKLLATPKAGGSGPSATERDTRPQWHCDDDHHVVEEIF